MNIISKPTATLEQVMQFIDNTPTAHSLCKAIVPMIYESAKKVGINPVVAVAQSLKETGYFNYKGVLRPNYCNICGLKGTTGGGDYNPDAHKRFDYWEDGVNAFIDHLALYCGVKGYPKYSKESELFYKSKKVKYDSAKYKKNGTTPDPRHFPSLFNVVKTVEDLSGQWCPQKDYSKSIEIIVEKIESTKVETKLQNEQEILKQIKVLEKMVKGE